MIWWAINHGRFNSLGRHPNIFYENGVSKEEIERIQQLDMLEALTVKIQSEPGFGYVKKDVKYI
jgi:hypothetical protein